MRLTGIVRRLDELGRVVIPKEIRKQLEISQRDTMEIYVEKNKIILKKIENTCNFCESNKNLIEYKGKLICRNCLKNIIDISNKDSE